jgi:hypothetical protein
MDDEVVLVCRGQSGTVGLHSVTVLVMVVVEVRVVVSSVAATTAKADARATKVAVKRMVAV